MEGRARTLLPVKTDQMNININMNIGDRNKVMLIQLFVQGSKSHTHTMLTVRQTRVDVGLHQLVILMSYPSLETSRFSSHANT